MVYATPQICSAIQRVSNPYIPMAFGLPQLTTYQMEDLFLSVTQRMCGLTDMWALFGQHALVYWVNHWSDNIQQRVYKSMRFVKGDASMFDMFFATSKQYLDPTEYVRMISEFLFCHCCSCAYNMYLATAASVW